MTTMKIESKNILIGITGGIASYKILNLISTLKKKGANVKVMMTSAATEFVSKMTFEALSGNRVVTEIHDEDPIEHISLSKWADVILIAPMTANTAAKISFGMGDNIVTATLLAATCPVVLAPAMNTNMLNDIRTVENLERLKKLGYVVTETDRDRLACGDYGYGKLISESELLYYLEYALTPHDLLGKTALVTTGSTLTRIDPVRFISNHSTGKMGNEIARALKLRGARVIVVSGNVKEEFSRADEFIKVETTDEMYMAVREKFQEVDMFFMAAAPCDFKIKNYSEQKLKKDHELDLLFESAPDIAKYVGENKGEKILVGFAAESTNEIFYGQKKLREKNMDMIVVNNITLPGAGFGTETNIATIITKDMENFELEMMEKRELAEIIVKKTIDLK